MLTLRLFPDVHHTWEEREVDKISTLRKDAGQGELLLTKSVSNIGLSQFTSTCKECLKGADMALKR